MNQEILDELYDSVIRDYSKNPRNFGVLKNHCCKQHGHNPSCGDELTLFVDKDTNTIKEVKWHGDGCSLFRASASMMTEKITGMKIDEGQKIVKEFIQFIIDSTELDEDYEPLHIFQGVKKFPLRVKCVLLPWRTMESIINERNDDGTS